MILVPLNKSRIFHLNSLPSVFEYNLGFGDHGHISRLEERRQEGKVSVLWMEVRASSISSSVSRVLGRVWLPGGTRYIPVTRSNSVGILTCSAP